MNQEQLKVIKEKPGFIAALDQSGGSTPKALATYGVTEDQYHDETSMFDQVHKMRTRIIKSPSFSSDYILGAILFENTMRAYIDNQLTADFLWETKGIVPFLKIDKGLAPQANGVQLMKDIEGLDELLKEANEKHIFGTKMRSVIHKYNEQGIEANIAQQFELAHRILAFDLIPIVEPEVNIHAENKKEIEAKMKAEIFKQLDSLKPNQQIMLKLSPPDEANLFADLLADPRILRIVFLSGGHSRHKANELLALNHGVVASFSRALSEGLNVNQSEADFDAMLKDSITTIYEASIT